jgi:hypothetical protein
MPAYWISPKNEIIDVPTNHIDVVIKNPETFGLTKEEIQKSYDAYGEQLGVEGKAREDIILDLIRKGWIRIRQYRNQGWSVNVAKMTKKVKDNLFDWVSNLTSNGIFGYKERDMYMPVNILITLDDVMKKVTIKDILSSVLYESLESFNVDNKLNFVVLKENKVKNWVDFILE